MANIREAILKAADSFENHPERFTFSIVDIPPDWERKGCALGRIFQALGKPANTLCSIYTQEVFGCDDQVFFGRLTALTGHGANDWLAGGVNCAKALRLYADHFFPAEPSRELKSGAEVCREIIRKPWKETEAA